MNYTGKECIWISLLTESDEINSPNMDFVSLLWKTLQENEAKEGIGIQLAKGEQRAHITWTLVPWVKRAK